MFVDNGKDSIRRTEKDNLIEDALTCIICFFVNLRYVSKQVDLPTGISNFFSITHLEISHLPTPYFPAQVSDPNVMLRKVAVDTSVTRKHLEEVATYLPNFKPPVFDTILLDAIRAFSDGDYRRAILYSAMSVEIIAATKLSSRANFAQLLHERSLHILNKSLLIDNEQLYQTARKLYRTRNKIVHQGEPSPEKDSTFFAMNHIDAQLALECAVEIFKWFGDASRYTIPDTGFVSGFYKIGELTKEK